jgi:uncharacterized protein with NRDE domain
VCLLVAVTRCSREIPLLIAANRDERYDRPTTTTQVLSSGPPRVIGGRDELAGGTWLAVNDAGVVAGITNVPRGGYRDPAKRSRGELPLLLAAHTTAIDAVAAIEKAVSPADYNPCYLLVADRDHCLYVDLSSETLRIEELPPGIVILENGALGVSSPKVDRVRSLIGRLEDDLSETARRFETILADHELPPPDSAIGTRNRETLAICVHTPAYGTRSSAVVTVGADHDSLPIVRVADGPACTTAFEDRSSLLAP